MNKEEYLKQCGVESSSKLTAEQILDYFVQGNGGPWNQDAAEDVKWVGCLATLLTERKP